MKSILTKIKESFIPGAPNAPKRKVADLRNYRNERNKKNKVWYLCVEYAERRAYRK